MPYEVPVARVIADPESHRDRDEAVAACIDCFEANKDRMRYNRSRIRGFPVGTGVVESVCTQIIGSRFKRSGCRWSKAANNALLAVKCCIERIVGPTSSIGGFVVSQPPDQKMKRTLDRGAGLVCW